VTTKKRWGVDTSKHAKHVYFSLWSETVSAALSKHY